MSIIHKLFFTVKLTSLCIFLSNQANADCGKLLRLEINKRLVKNTFLFSQNYSQLVLDKSSWIQKYFKDYPGSSEMINNKTQAESEKLKDILKTGILGHNIKETLVTFMTYFHSKSFIEEWVQDLYQDVLVELYSVGDFLDIQRFEEQGALHEKFIIAVLLERSKVGGFSGDHSSIKVLFKEAIKDKFRKVLLRQNYIYDISFEFKNHGHLIHMFQVDLMIQSLKKASLDPEMASYIYSWFGRNKIYRNPLLGVFSPLDAWSALFDSIESDFTSPEKLNPILKKYFEWTRQRHIVN